MQKAIAAAERNYNVIALLLAIIVLVFGFGAMNAFWFLGNWDASLLGLYEFKSATFGDALVLPALTYCISFILLKDGLWNKKTVVLLSLAAVVGLAGGIYSQYSWLSNADTILNWTIPQQHTFNAPGWYHAVFLCFMTALMAALVVGLVMTVVRRRREGATFSWHYGVVFCFSPAFFILNLNDFSTTDTPASTILWRCLVPAVVFFVIGFAMGGPKVISLLLAYLSAVSVWVAMVFAHAYIPVFSGEAIVAIGAFLSFSPIFSAIIAKLVPRLTYHLISFFVCGNIVTTLTIATASMTSTSASLSDLVIKVVLVQGVLCCCVGLLGVAIGLVDAKVSNTLRERSVKVFGRALTVDLILALLLIGLVPVFGLFLLINVHNDLFEAFTTLWSFSVGLGLVFLKGRWRELERTEDAGVEYWDTVTPPEYTDTIKRLRYRVWAWAIPILVSMVVLYAAADIKSIRSIGLLEDYHPPLSLTALAAVAGLLIINGLASVRRTPIWRYAIIVNVVAAPFLLALSVVRWLPLFKASDRMDIDLSVTGVVLFPIVALFLFTAASVRDNLYRMRGIQVDWLGTLQWMAVATVQISIASIGATGVLSMGGIRLGTGILTLLALFIYPSSTAYLSSNTDWDHYIAITPPLSGLLQDSVHTAVLSTLLIIYPSMMLLVSANLSTALVRILSLLGLLVIIFQWVLRNNIKHADRSDVFIDQHPMRATKHGVSPEDFKKILRSHIRQQNIFACVMLLPVIPVILGELELDDMGVSRH